MSRNAPLPPSPPQKKGVALSDIPKTAEKETNITPAKFENRSSTLKHINCFPSTLRRIFESAKIASHLGFVLKENSGKEITLFIAYRQVFFFRKNRFQNVYCPHQSTKQTYSNSSDLKSIFEKLRSCQEASSRAEWLFPASRGSFPGVRCQQTTGKEPLLVGKVVRAEWGVANFTG